MNFHSLLPPGAQQSQIFHFLIDSLALNTDHSLLHCPKYIVLTSFRRSKQVLHSHRAPLFPRSNFSGVTFKYWEADIRNKVNLALHYVQYDCEHYTDRLYSHFLFNVKPQRTAHNTCCGELQNSSYFFPQRPIHHRFDRSTSSFMQFASSLAIVTNLL